MTNIADVPAPPLQLTGVWKTYPGVVAVRGADFQCAAGEIHALIGENGAGKTTLMNIASGNVAADKGKITIGGRLLPVADPGRAQGLGLRIAYQDDSLIPDLSVAQNLLFGVPSEERPSFAHLDAWAQAQLNRFEMNIDPGMPVRDLTVASRQVVEIVKAILSEPLVLVLDEPTSALAPNEVKHLHEVLLKVVSSDTSVIYITHRLGEVFALADKVTVMRDGEIVQAGLRVAETSEDELVSLMVGRSFETAFPPKTTRTDAEPLLTVRNLSSDAFQDVNFDAYAGEILGIAGIEGNGQHEFIRALVGLEARNGRIFVNGTEVPNHDVNAARELGISYISDDRRGEALFMDLGVRPNMTVGSLSELARRGVLDTSRERTIVQRQITNLDLRASSQEQAVQTLSGGNQQKVALGRAFLESPSVYVISEPTQGVDAATRLEIYRHLRSATATGASVMVLSSDAVELSGLCDRVLVFVRGVVAHELTDAALAEDSIVGAAVRSSVHHDRDKELASGRRSRFERARTSDLAPLVLLLLSITLISAATGRANPFFLTSQNLGNFLSLAVPLGFAALAQAVVMLIGGIDLSVGPLIALITVAMAQIMNPEAPGENILLALAVSGAIGLGIGALNALLVVQIRLLPLIATLATYIFIQGIALLWSPSIGGYVSPEFTEAARFRIGDIPWGFVLLMVIAVVGEFVYRRTTIGLSFRAVGSRLAAARRLGINYNAVKYAAYILAGLFAVISGIFFTSTIGIGDPRLGVNFTLSSITAVVLGGLSTWGGRGSVIGPVIGAVLLALLSNVAAFMNFPSEVQFYVQGGLMLAAIALYSRLRATGRSGDEPVS